jgi:hypothetical protein
MGDEQVWRGYEGAEYSSIREVPCFVISNGRLLGADGESVHEDHPAVAAEIDRRGRDVYRDHGYGDGHDSVPVAGCDHSEAPADAEQIAEGIRAELGSWTLGELGRDGLADAIHDHYRPYQDMPPEQQTALVDAVHEVIYG